MIPREDLENVIDRGSLFAFLKNSLDWPVDPEDTFTYHGPSLRGETASRVEVGQIVPFSSEDPFAIMLAEFEQGFRRSDLREVLRAIKADQRTLAKHHGRKPDEFVFVCALGAPTSSSAHAGGDTGTPGGYTGIRFAHFKEQEGKQPKLSVFGWDADSIDETRTLREFNLPSLKMPEFNVLQEPDWDMGYSRWMEAWNVQKVTDEFYKKYNLIFKAAESLITSIQGDDKRLFTQKLFNRLLFIRFLEKKGWLIFNGRKDYLAALWEDYRTGRLEETNFHTTRLKPLFFAGLNNEGERDIMGIKLTGAMQGIIGDVPYLNGGLFDEEEDKEQNKKYPNIHVPDEAISPLLTELFYFYNFTVTESTPDDIEVAVDPEMLGKVFEELVTGRHESGSYYTPKPIVSFMCREGLKGYLQSALPDESPEALERFVDLHNTDQLVDPEDVLDALRNVKVCDPACGSGAYLLGMLHELMELRVSLFRSKHVDPRSTYERKLEIIQSSIYGVDIDQFAVNIARLRLWLSLAIEYERADDEPVPPLPNLDFKIERGDSLSAPAPSMNQAPDMWRQKMIRELIAAKQDFLTSHGSQKIGLRAKVEGLREEIAAQAHTGGQRIEGFDWQAEMAEMFTPDQRTGRGNGFDIVLANPPYIRQELIKDQKPILKETYGELFCGTADLYVYFYLRAIQLLKPGGMIVFISSNKWFRANYGVKLREYIAKNCTVLSITDFGELPVFKAATFPMIFVAQKNGGTGDTCFTPVKTLDPPYPDVLTLIRESGRTLPAGAISGSQWMLTDAATADRLKKMESAGIPLGEYVKGVMFRGPVTGLNKAFYINGAKRDELIAADPRSAEIIKPLVVGRDIHKWQINHRDRWLIFAGRGINIERYPAIKAHLAQWHDELEPKRTGKEPVGRAPGDYKWYELQASPGDTHRFEKPKIVYPDIAVNVRFAFDNSGSFTNNTAYMLLSGDLHLLGILNSTHVDIYYRQISTQIRGGYVRFFSQFVQQIPIPDASEADREAIAALVQKCLDAKGIDCEAWEREIDERVSALYGL